MKSLIFIPMILLAGCGGDVTSQTATGGGSIYNGQDQGSVTVINEGAPTTVTASSSERCSEESRAEGIC